MKMGKKKVTILKTNKKPTIRQCIFVTGFLYRWFETCVLSSRKVQFSPRKFTTGKSCNKKNLRDITKTVKGSYTASELSVYKKCVT